MAYIMIGIGSVWFGFFLATWSKRKRFWSLLGMLIGLAVVWVGSMLP